MDEDISTVAGVLSGYLKQCERLLHGEVHAKSLAHVANVLSKLPQLSHSTCNIQTSTWTLAFCLGWGEFLYAMTLYEPARTFSTTCPFLSLFYISFG